MQLTPQHLHDLNNNFWYAQLPEHFKAFIIEKSQRIVASKDQSIFRTGEAFNGIYAVLEGAVRLGQIDVEGREAVSAIAEPIMWFGEISLVDQQARSHDAVTEKKSILLHIPAQDIDYLIEKHPEFWFHIARLTSHKLRFALELLAVQIQNITQRLAQRLLLILNGYGNHIAIEKNTIQLSQEQLAVMLVCSRQTINQELQNLEKLNIIRISFKKIEILDIPRLHYIAYQEPIKIT